jgi:hypothetical protein
MARIMGREFVWLEIAKPSYRVFQDSPMSRPSGISLQHAEAMHSLRLLDRTL